MAAPGFENPSSAYLNGTTTPLKIIPKTGATAPPSTPGSSTATPSLFQQAIDQAQAALQGEISPIQNQITANDATATQRQADALTNAKALSDLLAEIAPAIQATYTNAANDQGILGKGFSSAVQDSLGADAANTNATLAKINAPVGQDVGPGRAANVADVLYGLGGFIPGSTFAQKGAAYAGAANMLPATALLNGEANAQQVRLAAQATDATLQNKIAELAGKLPGDVQTNYMNLQKLALDDAKFKETLKNDSFNHTMAVAKQKLAVAKYNTGVDEFNVNTKLKVQAATLAANKFAREQFQQDRMYAVTLQRLGVSETNLQLRIAANAFKAAHGGFSQKDITKLTGQANAMASSALNGSLSTRTVNGKTTTTQTGGIPYFQALSSMLKKGIPVQLALSALDRFYPSTARPTAAALAKELGPLAPDAILKASTGASTIPGASNSIVDSVATQPYKTFAFSQFPKYGWGAGEQAALDALWQRESGWNPGATNKGSGAAGIPQELGHNVPADYSTNPQTQISWGLNYIKSTYGTPSRAWAFWNATVGKNAAIAPPDLRAKAALWISKGYAGY